MKNLFRILLPMVILTMCGYAAWWLYKNQPVAEFREMPPSLVRVEGTVLKKTTHQVIAHSQGTVQPRTRSTLLPEVSAKVIEVGSAFRPGGFFEKGEMLIKLDPVDYETALVVSKASLAQAESMLAEEMAKSEQARENWKALGRSGEPSAMVLRVPQVAKAQADVASAKAQILKAERDLDRTIIRAPYAGQVLEQSVDVGQFVTQGNTLGKVFAVDYVEIRLPLPEREMRFLTLPEHFRDGSQPDAQADVKLKAVINGRAITWAGKVVRVESALDETTRQAVAVAQVNDPYAKRPDGSPPLKIGQFVEAQIEGQTLTDVFVIPRNAVRAGNEIILITPESRLMRMNVEPLAGDATMIVVSADSPKSPKVGDVLCLTPIPFPADGARVLATIDGNVENPDLAGSKNPGKKATATAAAHDKAS